MNILLIEDERMLALAVIRILNHDRHHVDWQTNGVDGLESALSGNYDLVVLDVLLPQMSGWDVCRDLRAADCNVPILMLSAMDEPGDKVRGLNVGADDFLSKPFDPAELVARVRALSRRDVVHHSARIRIDDLEIDRDRRKAARANVELPLSPIEYEILVKLAVREGRVLKPSILTEDTSATADPLGNPTENLIASLRSKVDAPGRVPLIRSVEGGYAICRQLSFG